MAPLGYNELTILCNAYPSDSRCTNKAFLFMACEIDIKKFGNELVVIIMWMQQKQDNLYGP